ncbi:MAG: hypothetical protein CUN55_14830 [Phototrophicales bacterium]|nr:MAG: hypothetical protein CUN55_14830 [Phototrophicales bacterium]
MKRALEMLEQEGILLPSSVDATWLTLGNVRTDMPNIGVDRRATWLEVAKLVLAGMGCPPQHHPFHAMRCRQQTVAQAYALMRERLIYCFSRGCDAHLSWQERALAFGSGLHTLQDSYCIGHCSRIDNGDPHSPIVDMHTYPSRQHPITTKRDAVWADEQQTAFRADAAAAITATVAALKIFVAQKATLIEPFLSQYVSIRADIAEHLSIIAPKAPCFSDGDVGRLLMV